MTDDTISRQAAIDAIDNVLIEDDSCKVWFKLAVGNLPTAEPTLYGYKIELLAYIARVMEKEGITAEQAVTSFDDLRMAVRLITEEVLHRVEEAVMK